MIPRKRTGVKRKATKTMSPKISAPPPPLRCVACGTYGKEMWEKPFNARLYTSDVSGARYDCEYGSTVHRATQAIDSMYVNLEETPPKTNKNNTQHHIACNEHFSKVVLITAQLYCDHCFRRS